MVFWRTGLWMSAVLLVSMLSIPVFSLKSPGGVSQTCSPRIDPVTGISRVMCTVDKNPSSNKVSDQFTPDEFIPLTKPPKIFGPTAYDKAHGVTPTNRKKTTITLPSKLCPAGRTPYSGMDPNPEGHVSRITQCLASGSVFGQEGASFLPRAVQLSRWRQLRDPFPYTQKHNRPLQLKQRYGY